MRAATLAAGGARWVWVWVWVGDAVRCGAMRCDAMRRAGGRCWGRFTRASSRRDAGAAASVSQAAHAQNRGQSGQHRRRRQHHRGVEGAGGRRRRGQAGRGRAQCGEQHRCTQARRITTTRLSVPTRRPSGSLPAAAQRPRKTNATPAVRRLQRRRSQRTLRLPASRVTHGGCVVRALLLAMLRHALAEQPPAHSWPAAAETAPEAGSASGPRLPTHAALRVHLA
jgi:hypothetical protein